jgi:hypothetical protein
MSGRWDEEVEAALTDSKKGFSSEARGRGIIAEV